jgi:hypothetical protein
LACEAVAKAVRRSSTSSLWSRKFALETLEEVQDSIAETAGAENRTVRDFACTLLVAIAGHDQVAFWQIGDGAICFTTGPGESFNYAFWPAHGEYANVTEFVTDLNAAERLQFDAGEMAISDLALFSDGLERLALDFDSGEVHTPFFSSLFPHLYRRSPGHLLDLEAEMRGFLSSDRLNARTDDDKTLILATRVSDAA